MKKYLIIALAIIAALVAAYVILVTWASKKYGEDEPEFDDFEYFE